MYKLVLLFAPPEDASSFQSGWQTFLGLAEAMPGLRKEVVSHIDGVIQGKPSLYMIHDLYFDSRAALEEALRSEAGQKAGQFLQTFTHGQVTILIAEHKEALEEDFRSG